MTTLNDLENQLVILKEQIQNIGPIIDGSIAQNGWHCKNSKCKCNTDGQLHRSLVLCWQEDGKSYAKHIPKALHQTVRQWIDNKKEMKAIIKQIAAVQREIFYLLREEAKTK